MHHHRRDRLVAHRDRTGFAIITTLAVGLTATSQLGGAWLYLFLTVFALAASRWAYRRGRDFERNRIRAHVREAVSPTWRAEA